MLINDIINKYPWYHQHQNSVFKIAAQLNMELPAVLETLDKMLGKKRHTPAAFLEKHAPSQSR